MQTNHSWQNSKVIGRNIKHTKLIASIDTLKKCEQQIIIYNNIIMIQIFTIKG